MNGQRTTSPAGSDEIDVRGADAYKMSHIKGASNVPLSKLETGDFKDLPQDKLIIAYCS